MHELGDFLDSASPLRPGITRRDGIDQLWLLMDPAVYQRLTRHRNWTARK